jgi:hypothetical protein
LRRLLVSQVVQHGDCHHNISILKSRVSSKGLRVTNYESWLAAIRTLGKRNIIGVNVEADVFYIRKALQSLRRTASNVDHLVTRLGSDMVLNDPATERISTNGFLKYVVEGWDFQPA